jgi:hypothetical protein
MAMSHVNILNIKFFLKKNRAKNNFAPLYVRIVYGGYTTDLSLKRDIDLDKWDAENGRPKGSREDVRIINNQLDQVRAESQTAIPSSSAKAYAQLQLAHCGNIFSSCIPHKKTNQTLRIPLLPKAQVIMQKYRNDPRAAFTGTVFAALSNQKLNPYLKEIADLCAPAF